MPNHLMCIIGGGKGGGGGARGLKPPPPPPLSLLRGGITPLRMISQQNYLSWSGAENRDKDQDTLFSNRAVTLIK